MENDTSGCNPFYTYRTRQEVDSDGDNVDDNRIEESNMKCGSCDSETSWHSRNEENETPDESPQETQQAPVGDRPVFLSPL